MISFLGRISGFQYSPDSCCRHSQYPIGASSAPTAPQISSSGLPPPQSVSQATPSCRPCFCSSVASPRCSSSQSILLQSSRSSRFITGVNPERLCSTSAPLFPPRTVGLIADPASVADRSTGCSSQRSEDWQNAFSLRV